MEIAASDGGAAKVISGSTNKKAKKICWVHMDVVNRGSKLKEFRNAETARAIYSKFDWIVPVSEACRDNFTAKFGADYPMIVKRNPMPVADILTKANALSTSFRKDEINVVCVGRLVEQKGFDRLLDACEEIKTESLRNPVAKYHIYIVGEGTNRGKLEQSIQEKCLEDTVSLLGFQENPYPYIKQADVFLLSSRDESFSLVVGESLIIGTPVIATDCCGVKEWLADGRYGLITENSTEGICNGLLHILRNPGCLSAYREKIPEAQKKISFEEGLKNFEQILEG